MVFFFTEESMPIYEYSCAACGHCFERIMKVGEKEPACPACGARETEKRVAPFRTNAWSAFLDGMEGKFAYATNEGDNTISNYTINATTGAIQ
jgi:putative FmdB family regulatory protein